MNSVDGGATPIELRDYQRDIVSRLEASMRAGHRAPLAQLPTGGGKGAIIVHLTARACAKQRRTLVIVPRIVLADDLKERHDEAGVHAGVIQATTDTDPGAPVQIATWQTLHKRGVRPPADLVIVDEARHAASAGLRQTLADYPAAHMIGFDATPQRPDGKAIDVFDDLVQGPSILALTHAGWLVPVEIVSTKGVLGDAGLVSDPVVAYQRWTPGARALVFAQDSDAAREIVSQAESQGITTRLLLASTSRAKRNEAREAITSGAARMLVNVAVATEGFDLPPIEVVVLASGCDHPSTLLQKIGRGLRPSPATGKTKCTVLDLHESWELGHPYDEWTWTLQGAGVTREAIAPVYRCLDCGAVFRERGPCPRCGATTKRTKKVTRVLSAAEKMERINAITDPVERDAALLRKLKLQARNFAPQDRVGFVARAMFRKRYQREPLCA